MSYDCEKCKGFGFTGFLWWSVTCSACKGDGRARPPVQANRPLPPPPPPAKHCCSICKRPHVDDEDRERARLAGCSTAYNVRKAQEAYAHYMHDHAVKNTPPEYAI